MHVMFLPGGSGAPEFWYSLGTLLPAGWKKTYLSWPGLGKQPPGSAVNSFDGLVSLAEKEIKGPTVLVAQSLGGVVGIRLALKYPSKITCLVLAATSGGVDIARLGGEDWRPDYLSNFPNGARWIIEEKPDHTHEIPKIGCPSLLLWGDNDSISPVTVGKHFLSLLPNARLHVVEGGDHYFARGKAVEVAPLVTNYVTAVGATEIDGRFNTSLDAHALRGSAQR
jgi:pimeloyl-ACP methyl ester carboxylesterase